MSAREPAPADVGLCFVCRHARRIASARGSVFYRCGLADRDPAFVRYPPLPVLRCAGFAPDESPPPEPPPEPQPPEPQPPGTEPAGW